MKRIIFLLLILIFVHTAEAQNIKYVEGSKLTLLGKAHPTPNVYHRVDTATFKDMPLIVKKIYAYSAGIAIAFETNSRKITAKWSTVDHLTSSNLTAIADKGLDLYIKKDGKWVFAGVGSPRGNSTETTIVQNMDESVKECILYLPLYDEIRSLEIGVEENSDIRPMGNPFRGKVVLYGSSILNGSSASRPGMAYPSRMGRNTGINFINLGVSGNAKMERSVVDMLSSIECDLFVLDCVPNPSPNQIRERTDYLVRKIRETHPKTPIILIQGPIRESGNFDLKAREHVRRQNETFKEEYKKLIQSGVKDLFFIEGDFLGTDHEGTIDGVHPNDLGFDRFLKIIEPRIIEIWNKYAK